MKAISPQRHGGHRENQLNYKYISLEDRHHTACRGGPVRRLRKARQRGIRHSRVL
jgi:hypothetical protein